MAWKMQAKIKGITYQDGYWRLADEIYESAGKIRAIFQFYGNQDARQEDIMNFFDKPAKPYYLLKTDIEDWDNLTNKEKKAALYVYSKNFLEGEPPHDEEEDTRVSFFEQAISV